MPERPPIIAIGTIVAERTPDRLYEIAMANGHCALAVVPKAGPRCTGPWRERQARVDFSPYDMSRCRIRERLPASDPVADPPASSFPK